MAADPRGVPPMDIFAALLSKGMRKRDFFSPQSFFIAQFHKYHKQVTLINSAKERHLQKVLIIFFINTFL
jgi:hypothetical protein